jgi:hypothetical protein
MDVRVYDPGRQVYYTAQLADYQLQLESLGLTEEEVQVKLDEKKEEIAGQVAGILGTEGATLDIQDGKIVIEAQLPAEPEEEEPEPVPEEEPPEEGG